MTVWRGEAAPDRAPPPDSSAFDKSEEVRVNQLRVRCAHSMGQTFVNPQGRALQQFGGQRSGIGERNDLVVASMHNNCRTVIVFRSCVKSVSENALMPR